MNTKHLTIAGPYTHENLSIFLLLGADAVDGILNPHLLAIHKLH
jgi:hypothetical protein